MTVITKKEPDLYRRSVKGGFWVSLLQAASYVLAFVKSIIIANYFFLDNIGIITAALMMMEILSTFTQTGFDSALIQKKEVRGYIDTAWTFGVFKGILLFAIFYFAAPLLATIRIPGDQTIQATWIFRTVGAGFIIGGLQNAGLILFQKEMEFHKVFLLSLSATLTDIFVSIGCILFFNSIWGIVAARIASSAVHCAGSYVLSSYRPRLCFDLAKAKELWKFGRWISGQSILGYILEMGDNLFVWFYLGLPSLALYKYAYNFANMPFDQINSVFLKVLFPAYSKIQDDLPRLREAYYKVLKATAMIIIPISFLIFYMGPVFVRLFLTEQWRPMILTLQILAFKGLLKSLGSTRVPFFQAMGKPNVLLHLMSARVLLLAATIYFFTRLWGIAGTALSTTLLNVIINPISLIILCRMFQFNIWTNLRQSILPCCAATSMIAVLFALRSWCLPQVTKVSFFGLIGLGLSIYIATLWILDSIKNFGYRQIVIEQVDLIKHKLKR